MSLKPFPDFKSLATHHCVTGSMLHIYRYNEIPISEEMILGLGSGMGFIYWQQKGIDPFLGGRVNLVKPGEEGLEHTASRRLGIESATFNTTSARKAEKALLELLEAKQPVMLRVDMGFLPYFEFGGEEYHFGYLTIVVAGYDPETRQVLLADRDLGLHSISWENLAKARGSTFKPFPPKHSWYTFDFSLYHPPKPVDVILSIQEAATGMLEPPISNFGVKGIRKAAKRILKWSDELDERALRRTCFNIFVFIDAMGGTGGGIFRYMYGRYLKEAAEITGIDAFAAVGEQFKVIGDRWQDVADIFKRAFDVDGPATMLPETTEPLMGIADMEQESWGRLREIAG
ncbi:MAG: BtrH N-terminal domain-containing protein [Anaerolineales bacterium]|nr:BtrH N-terminal domain-containing protein [Chloroflexota bacterium]MBL6980749.1 BtrH N-terminal domain-containing protein [Anaerolineales bacterium]